jgi:hypothetical protein
VAEKSEADEGSRPFLHHSTADWVKQREVLDNIAYELAFSHVLSVPGCIENLLHTHCQSSQLLAAFQIADLTAPDSPFPVSGLHGFVKQLLMPSSHGAMSDQYDSVNDSVAWDDWLQQEELQQPFW